jgi:hypothetical protein
MAASFESLAAASKAPLVIATVAGTGHLSFSDAPFVMPETITRFGGKVIEERRGWLVITSAIRAFLDDVFAAQASAAFAGALKSTPELEVQVRSPSAK